MATLLFFIPLVTTVFASLVYRFTGKKDFWVFDLVQFMYMFFFSPLLFIWAKSFLRYILSSELGFSLTERSLFVIDTGFSVFFLYIYAFVVIHSMTKTFNLKRYKDPFYDFFEDSEFLHLWLSHQIMFFGAAVILLIFGLLNSVIAIDIQITRLTLHLVSIAGILCGIILYITSELTNPGESKRFMRILKLLYGVCFSILMLFYLALDPSYSSSHSIFWWVFMLFSSTTAVSFFSYRSKKAKTFLEMIAEYLKHIGWEFKVKEKL